MFSISLTSNPSGTGIKSLGGKRSSKEVGGSCEPSFNWSPSFCSCSTGGLYNMFESFSTASGVVKGRLMSMLLHCCSAESEQDVTFSSRVRVGLVRLRSSTLSGLVADNSCSLGESEDSSKILRTYFGGRRTSCGMGFTPSGNGYEERRCFRKSSDQDKKVPSILHIVSK